MIFFYIHYLLVFGVSSLTAFSKKAQRLVCPLVFLLLFVFAALRGKNVGRDYLIYIDYFEKILSVKNYYWVPERYLYYEPSFYLIPLFAQQIMGPYGDGYLYLSFVIFALLGVYVKLRSLRISNSFFLSVVLYLTTFFLVHEMIQIRVGVASGIFLLSLPHLLQRNRTKYVLYILAACFFHYSSLIYLPLMLLDVNRINKRIYYGLLLAFSLLSLAGLNVFNLGLFSFISPKIEQYSKLAAQGVDAEMNIWTNFGFLINLLFTILMLRRAAYLQQKNQFFTIMIKIQVLSIVALLALSAVPVIAIRISHALGVVQLLLFPCIIYLFRKRVLGYAAIILVSLIYFYNYFYRVPMFGPYYTWLTEP